jgi:hypothetical protein
MEPRPNRRNARNEEKSVSSAHWANPWSTAARRSESTGGKVPVWMARRFMPRLSTYGPWAPSTWGRDAAVGVGINAVPTFRSSDYGFRVARTFTP